MTKNRTAKLETAIHLLTAFVLLIKGYDKLSHGNFAFGTVIFLFGIAVVLITLLHRLLNISHNRSKAVVYVIEGIALFLIACLSFNENKIFLPYFFLFPSIAFMTIALLAVREDNKIRGN